MLPIVKYFKVKNYKGLEGKVFRSKESDPETALTLFYIDIINDFKYKVPTPEEIFDILAKALVKKQAPDYSKYYSKDVIRCYATIFDRSGYLRESWFNNFKEKVKKLSNDKIIIIKFEGMTVQRSRQHFFLICRSGEKKLFYLSRRNGSKVFKFGY